MRAFGCGMVCRCVLRPLRRLCPAMSLAMRVRQRVIYSADVGESGMMDDGGARDVGQGAMTEDDSTPASAVFADADEGAMHAGVRLRERGPG